uniref:PX domain-containing protein n=1 Tax=Phytophthora ramorum TaxID=164328 RepID=H3HE57_PHYRM
MEGVAPSQEPSGDHNVSTEQAIMLALDALFLLIGIVYGSRVLAPKPMTYLSEIAFPMDFCGKLAASFTLFLLNGLQWLYQEIFCSWLLYHRPFGRDQQNVVAMMETLVWGTSSSILWMEYRRGLTPSLYLRLFWLIKWIDSTLFLVVSQHMVFGGVCYVASAILALFLFIKPTTVTPDFIAYPTEVNTPSAYLNSSNHQPPTSLYGSFKDWELVAYFVAFKIVVQTDEDHWTLRRPYSDFAALHEELPEQVRADCPLPPEECDDRRLISWKDRPRSLKSRLEMYMKQVLHHPMLAPYASQALWEFLEM